MLLLHFHAISGSPVISSITYNTTSGVVTCISTGGPATTVTWSRSGPSYQQSKIVVDTINATYHNLLSIKSFQVLDYTGTFNCTVCNNRGSTFTNTAEFKGNFLINNIGPFLLHLYTLFYFVLIAIGLFGNHIIYNISSSAHVTCYSNFTMSSIIWINESQDIKFSTHMIASQELLLTVTEISRDTHHNAKFICAVEIILPSNITIINRISFVINTEELSKYLVIIR